MKIRLLCYLVLTIFYIGGLEAGDDKVNVLGYYAVNNSIDGQLMIDKVNILRFYPVFAMRDSVDQVNVTIYYGGNIFSRNAEKMDDGKYWQILLPIFRLGEAIQRLEVEVHFGLSSYYQQSFQQIKKLNDAIEQEMKDWREVKRHQFGEVRKKFEEAGISFADAHRLRVPYDEGDFARYGYLLDSLSLSISKNKKPEPDKNKIRQLIPELSMMFNASGSEYELLTSEKQQRVGNLRDSLSRQLAKEIEAGLMDTLYVGPSVRKSDLTIDSGFTGARILYRNYKKELRYMPALDPAERMGIFRIRYVPFPITALPHDEHTSLRGPFGETSTVIEVGMAFGDAIVPGDEFVVPEFSFKRLGVAFAITEKLFNDDAEIIALALTYDFNSYGSIGVGGNFAQHRIMPYASFGINKKAFEAVLSGLTGLFR